MHFKTLYFGNPARLSLSNEQCVIERKLSFQEQKHRVPIEDIGIIVLDNPEIVITHPLIIKLLKNNVVIISCDEKHLPIGHFQSYYANHVHTETLHAQLNASKPLRKRLWAQTVRTKIENQAAVLSILGEEYEPLLRWAKIVKSGDPNNIEARAAAYYWTRVFDSENVFTRDRFGEAPNNALNFGYAIVRSMVARALTASGLHPAFGIHHHNKYNPYCLADDIMEPYRPFLDMLVVQLHAEYGQIEKLKKEHKAYLLSIATIDVLFGNRTSPLSIGIQRSTASLARCFRGEDKEILYPSWSP